MVRGSPLFRKLLAGAFVLLAFALITLDFYLTRYTAARETHAVESRLAAEARLLADELAAGQTGDILRFAADADHRAGARVTVINPRGVVLADSEHDAGTMENHAGRPEVRKALQGATGAAVRHSATLDRDFCYVAIPLIYGGQRGFVLRLAVPLEEVDKSVAAVQRRIVEASALAAVLALVLAYFFSIRLSRRIGRLRRFAERLLHSPEPEELVPESNDEVGALSRALNDMGSQLRQSIERLRIESSGREAILASMVEGVLAVDHQMRILFSNESFSKMVRPNTPMPERHVPVVSVIRDSVLVSMLADVLATGEALKARLELPAAAGRVFEVQTAALVTAGQRGAIAIFHEITEIERLERIRKDFVANVSHELRTPLAAIRGYSETLLDGGLEDASINRKFLETINAHAIRLTNISADLLTLSELDSKNAAVATTSVSLKDSISLAMRTVESEARIRDVKLDCNDFEDIEISGHKLRLEQALINLLDNAIKFNRPGGEARVEVSRSASGQAKIRIADTGVGIPAQDLHRIFERFYRVDKVRSRDVGGTGLGLAIAKHAIELMNGSIEVASAPGKGSTFTVVLPVSKGNS